MVEIETDYQLIDSGDERKLERFGKYILSRPCPQAIWGRSEDSSVWESADALFTREGPYRWIEKKTLPKNWSIKFEGMTFKLTPTDFGHLGIFPEHAMFWNEITSIVSSEKEKRGKPVRILNLFAYSGGATLAAARGGADVCHLDSSPGMIDWARENAILSDLKSAPIRWIVDDVRKFVDRELRRGAKYDGIILDPPSFGRGKGGKVFKIETDLIPLLKSCFSLLSETPLFVLLSCHTPGFTPLVLKNTLSQVSSSFGGVITEGELLLEGNKASYPIPSGTFACWKNKV